jgi:hypothetical protein
MSETLVPTDCRALLRGDLPVLKSGVENLKEMGITGIRQGGSFASQPYKDSRDGHYGDQASMFWKRWTGPPWARPSLGQIWGAELLSGW